MSTEVKYIHEDFLVREEVAIRLVPKDIASHELLLLRKRGFTTTEAVSQSAHALAISERAVGYCGRKDEDGVSEQLVSIPIEASERMEGHSIREGNEERWFYTQHYGYVEEPLRVGRLAGNSFRIILRNLPQREADTFAELRKINFMFLNYYDTQRFGVPDGPKRTHLVGAAMLEERWDDARELLIELKSPESIAAEAWSGTSRDFFLSLDPRVMGFFPAAHASFAWNEELARLARDRTPKDLREVSVDDISFVYPSSTKAVATIAASEVELPIARYAYDSDELTVTSSVRSTVVQTVVVIERVEDDVFFPGQRFAEISFFLPSGCYATAAVRQLLEQLT